eukprot:scaffold255039_cov47-Prasinocladus_malaysianus.AAC.1
MSDIIPGTETGVGPEADAVEDFETPQMIGDIIISKAEEVNAAAVVMAAHSKSPLMEFFMGSISNFCIHHCSRPLIHKLASLALTIFLHLRTCWLSFVDIEPKTPGAAVCRHLAVAIDDSQQSAEALKWTMATMYRP